MHALRQPVVPDHHNRFLSTVPGCDNSIPDPYGTTISYGGDTPETLAFWQQRIDRADYLVLYALRDGRIALGTGRRRRSRVISARREGILFLYVRHGFPAG